MPGFDLAAFEEELLTHAFPIFACTRQDFFECQRLKYLKDKYPPEYDRALPLAASTMSGGVHDALWSVYFATGEAACIFRLLDMAACSFARYQSLVEKNEVVAAAEAAAAAKDGLAGGAGGK